MKLVLFGVTHICAIDGFSGMIVGFVTMPTILGCCHFWYCDVYKNNLMNYGLWDQLRIDHGREWYLFNRNLLNSEITQKKTPFIQTSSKKVNPVVALDHIGLSPFGLGGHSRQ